MKILLINPVLIKKSFATLTIVEPIGLEYLASSLLDRHEVEIFDGLPTGIDPENIINTIEKFKPDVVGISVSFSMCIKTAKDMTDFIKNSFPDLPIVFGGNAATFTAEELIKHPSVDIIVMGEGEITFRELIDALEQKNYNWENIAGLCYKDKTGEIRINKRRTLVKDLDSIPFPAHSILKNKPEYKRTIITGRGCPHGCIYCSTSAFFGNYRKRSISNIMGEIELLFTSGFDYANNNIMFIDDNFTVDENRVKEFCKEISLLREKLGQKIFWTCNARIEDITENLLITMRDAGCETLLFGVESGSEDTLKFLKRNYTPDDVIRVTRMCKNLGIHTISAFIVGLPYETKEDLEKTYDLIRKIPDISGVCILTAFPGTPIYNDPDKYNLTIHPHLPEQDNLNQCAWVSTKYLTKEEVMEAYYKSIGICVSKGKKYSLM